MTRYELIDQLVESLLQTYYDDQYNWFDSLSKEELLEEASYILQEEVIIDD